MMGAFVCVQYILLFKNDSHDDNVNGGVNMLILIIIIIIIIIIWRGPAGGIMW